MTRVALVTGASSGLGKELSLQLADRGYDIALLARRSELLESLAERISKKGRKVLVLACDVVKGS